MEHLHIEQSAPNRPLNDDNNNTKHTNNNDDALCPICLSEMDISEQLCSCSACNNYLHRPCMDVWSQVLSFLYIFTSNSLSECMSCCPVVFLSFFCLFSVFLIFSLSFSDLLYVYLSVFFPSLCLSF